MNKNEILIWEAKYNKEEDLYNTGLEEELRAKFQKNKFVTKDDLKKIVNWKFQDHLKGRREKILNFLAQQEDEIIQNSSRDAFNADDDTLRLRSLTKIKGVGVSLSSVILSFYDPERYGIFDIHAWRELYDIERGKEPSDLFTNHKYTLEFFTKLRKIAEETGLTCRVVEKALFKKNLDESKS